MVFVALALVISSPAAPLGTRAGLVHVVVNLASDNAAGAQMGFSGRTGRFDFAGLLDGDYMLEQTDNASATPIGQLTIHADGKIELGSFVGK